MQRFAEKQALEPGGDFYLSLSFFFFVAGMLPFLDSAIVPMAFQAQRAFLYGLAFLCFIRAFGVPAILQALRRLPLPAPLVFMMAWAALSYMWSADPQGTALRWTESAVCMAYGSCFTVLALDRFGNFSDIAQVLKRAIIWIAIYALVANVFIYGEPLYMYENPWIDRPRLRFLYAHPLMAGDILSLGILCGIFSPRIRALDLVGLLGLFYLLLLTDSTAALLVLPMVLLLKWLSGANFKALQLRLGALLVATTFGLMLLFLLAPTLLDSPDLSRFLTLTGRTKLWDTLLSSRLISSFFGTGFDASDAAIFHLFNKEYHAHNEYLSSLIELGYVGLTLHLLMLGAWMLVLARVGKSFLWAVFIYIVFIGVVNPVLLTKPIPIFFFMLSLVGSMHLLRSPAGAMTEPRRW